MTAAFRLRVLPRVLPIDGREVGFQNDGTYIQWRYEATDTQAASDWTNLVALADITGPEGPNVELRNNGTSLQWRVEGDVSWIDLISIADMTAGATAEAEGYAADAAASAAAALAAVPNAFPATRTVLKGYDTSTITAAYLKEAGREGQFLFRAGDYSSEVTADTQEGVYVKADDTAASSGAWVRVVTAPVNVKWFGAVGDGVADDTTAINAALSLFGGKSVFLPQGTYLVTGLTIDAPNTSIFGDSARILFNQNTGGAITVTSNASYCLVRDLLFTAPSQRSGGAYIYSDCPFGLLIKNCYFESGFVGVLHTGGSIVTVDNCEFRNFNTSNSSDVIYIDTPGADVSITECVFDNDAGSMPRSGIRAFQVQDLTITGCNIIHCGNDLLIDPPTGKTVAAVWADNTFFDTAQRGVYINGGNGGNIVRCSFTNCWMSSHTNEGVRIDGGAGTVAGIHFDTVHAHLNADGVMVNTNAVQHLHLENVRAAQNTGSGITIGDSNTLLTIMNSHCGNVDGLTGNAYGIYIGNSCTSFVLTDNICRGNTTAQISHGSISGSGNRSINNVGLNDTPVASAVTVGSSPFTYTANSRPQTLYVEGGAVSSIVQNGGTIFIGTGKTIALAPNGSVTVTYSSLPYLNTVEH